MSCENCEVCQCKGAATAGTPFDNETRELVDALRLIALDYHDHQSLRQRISQLVVPHVAKVYNETRHNQRPSDC